MDIIIEDTDIIDANEHLLIHLFFNLFDYDFRDQLLTNKSSIYDMDGYGFVDEDYTILHQQYYEQCPEHFSYSEGRQFYQKLSNAHFDKFISNKFYDTYAIELDKKCHLLTDIIQLLHNNFPERQWESDTVFIIKTLDNRNQQQERDLSNAVKADQKVIKFPVRKKLSPEEIKNGYNEYLMMKTFGMTWDEARQLAKDNFNKKMSGKKFEPYLPDTITKKPKM